MRVMVYHMLVALAGFFQPKVAISKDRVMAYQHPELITRLVTKLEMSHERATAAFEAMKLYLYSAALSSEPMSPSLDADEAWHNFMLFSRDYAEFCFNHFGFFIHHQPFSAAKVKEMKAAKALCTPCDDFHAGRVEALQATVCSNGCCDNENGRAHAKAGCSENPKACCDGPCCA